jgi:hypothetical protein
MEMKNAFMESESEDMDKEDKKEEMGVTLVFSKKDAKKVMDYCDKQGIMVDEDME